MQFQIVMARLLVDERLVVSSPIFTNHQHVLAFFQEYRFDWTTQYTRASGLLYDTPECDCPQLMSLHPRQHFSCANLLFFFGQLGSGFWSSVAQVTYKDTHGMHVWRLLYFPDLDTRDG